MCNILQRGLDAQQRRQQQQQQPPPPGRPYGTAGKMGGAEGEEEEGALIVGDLTFVMLAARRHQLDHPVLSPAMEVALRLLSHVAVLVGGQGQGQGGSQ